MITFRLVSEVELELPRHRAGLLSTPVAAILTGTCKSLTPLNGKETPGKGPSQKEQTFYTSTFLVWKSHHFGEKVCAALS